MPLAHLRPAKVPHAPLHDTDVAALLAGPGNWVALLPLVCLLAMTAITAACYLRSG